MKTKKLLIATFLVLSFFAVLASPAHAAWANCTVVKLGPASSSVLILLKACDGEFTGYRWYYLWDTCKKEMMATALTAMVNSWQVRVNTSSATYAAYSNITSMHLSKTPECP